MIKKYWNDLRLETYGMEQFEKESTVDKMINLITDVSNWVAEGRDVSEGMILKAATDVILLVSAGYDINELADKYVVDYVTTDNIEDFIKTYITNEDDLEKGIRELLIEYYAEFGNEVNALDLMDEILANSWNLDCRGKTRFFAQHDVLSELIELGYTSINKNLFVEIAEMLDGNSNCEDDKAAVKLYEELATRR